MLGLLLMDPGVLVRRDTIIDVLWGDSPPRTAVGLVQAHVSRIRKLLEPAQGARAGDDGMIDSVGGAYRLSLSGRSWICWSSGIWPRVPPRRGPAVTM